jgi:hypothetical protein
MAPMYLENFRNSEGEKMKPDPENALRKRIEDVVKKRKTKEEDVPTFRGGRSWNQIADDFCTKILRKLEADNVSSVTLTGNVAREMAGDPDNQAFRSRCLVHGIKIIKDNYTNAYKIEKFSVVERELKKRDKKKGTGM